MNQAKSQDQMTEDLHVKVTPAHKSALLNAAREMGVSISTYCRLRLRMPEIQKEGEK